MEQSRLGSLAVSRIGFGCYAMSGVYGAKDPAIWEPLLRTALEELGITLFDTADAYGPAEEILGQAVAPFRERVAIATKVGVTGRDRFDTSGAHLREACEASLRRLRTDHIDLYQVHYDDPRTPVAETVSALEGLRAEGKIREYGVGHLPVPRVRDYLDLGRPASALFELSAAARGAQRELLPLLRERGLPGIAFSPTGRGLLAGVVSAGGPRPPGELRAFDPLFQREKLASGLRIKDRLVEIGSRIGRTPAQVAIAWVLAQPGVAVALTGPSKVEHLRENAGAAGRALPDEELRSLGDFLAAEEAEVRWSGLEAARGIVSRPLDRTGDAAFRDLLYALETAVEQGEALEKEVLPLAFRLLALRKESKGAYLPQMDEIREALRRLFKDGTHKEA